MLYTDVHYLNQEAAGGARGDFNFEIPGRQTAQCANCFAEVVWPGTSRHCLCLAVAHVAATLMACGGWSSVES
jgi:hypothetical protein